jgi:hypothetical protein
MNQQPQQEEPSAIDFCRALLDQAERRATQAKAGRRTVAWGAAALGFLAGVAVGVLASGIVV